MRAPRSARRGKELKELMEAIYRVDGASRGGATSVETSAFAGGPWDPKLQHGAAPSSLICWAVERLPSPVPMRVARLTVDLMRPVPVAPLTIETGILREGKKIQLVEVRLLANGTEVVRATALRIRRPIVEGEPISPLMRAAIAADFCNGTSSVLDFRQWTFINGDLTLSLAREPVGEWILLDAETWAGPDSIGIAAARLADRDGYFGRAVQSVLFEKR
jgi:hypothetical protein